MPDGTFTARLPRLQALQRNRYEVSRIMQSVNASQTSAAPSSMIGRHWRNRKIYRRTGDWIWSLYNRALNRSTGRILPGRGKVRPVHVTSLDRPLYIRLGATDWLVLEELFVHDVYGSVLRTVSEARHIIDLGANIGLSVRLWQKHYPNAQIVAVEPDEGNFAVCQMNVEAGENPKRVLMLKTCAAGSSRPVVLNRTGGEWGFSIASAPTAGVQAMQSQTMPQILEQANDSQQVDLLKCDIEGAEAELFADCGPWIRRMKSIMVELHAPYDMTMFLLDIKRGGGEFDVTTIYESTWNTILLLHSKV
jgi:FkbM family methyltransferase